HVVRGDVAGYIAAVFIALVVIVGPVRALAQDTEGAAIQTLDLGDVVEERMRRELGIHGHKYMCITYIYNNKKRGEKSNLKNLVRRPPTGSLVTIHFSLSFKH